MTSKFKVQTENIQPLSSGVSIGVPEPQFKLSVGTDNTQHSTPTSPKKSKTMLSIVKNVSEITEKSRQHAMLLKVLLSRLEKVGLIRRYKVLSKDGTTLKEIQIVFSPNFWTENLDLKVLSTMTTVLAVPEAKE